MALNTVASLDGRITVAGRSGPLGNDADRELFHELRAQVDAVMVGAGTLRTERYQRLVRSREMRDRREEAGLARDPWAIVISGRLALTPDIPLLGSERSRVLVLTSSDGEIEGARARMEYLRQPPEPESTPARGLTLAPLLEQAQREFGIGTILCEGGALVNAALAQEGLVDEYFLCVAPMLVAGDGPTALTGPALDPPADARLISAHESGGHLFLRYGISRGAG